MLRTTVFATTLTVIAATLTLATGAASAAATVPGDPLAGSGVTNRTVLTAAQLTSGSSSGTVANSAFALPVAAAAPAHEFEGTLTLSGLATAGGMNVIKDPHGYATLEPLRHLPPFSVQLVQNGSHLVPAVRGVQVTGSDYWNLQVGAGRAWSETSDGGMTRAALPFALIERNANCVHNGLLTFLFDDTGASQARYQITSETCEYFQFDMWGQVPTTYLPTAVTGADGTRSSYADEVSARLPVKPISQLTVDHPGAGISLSAFGGGITPSALSTFGFVFGGTNYVGTCPARQGDYPYCGQLFMPSYSTAKSAFAGISILRLGQKYGDGIYDELVRDYVPEAAALSAWNGVTIRQALNMATGNYDSAGYEVDEAGSRMLDFFLAEPYGTKLSTALAFPRKATPGSSWVYHTSDTFVATQAMDAYLKDVEGASADLFDMLRDEVLEPIGVGPDSLTTLRTDNSPTGAAFGGYGMFWTQDDIAKVAQFLAAGDGSSGGVQLLNSAMLDDAMQRDPSDRGMSTTGSTPFQYNNAFWARQFTSADSPAFTESFWVPFMSGFGGITVAIMPNGSSYYVFSDNNEFSWTSVVAESHKLASMSGDGGGGGGGGECTAAELIGNGAFETGSATPWTASSGVVDNRTWLQAPHSGNWKAWLNGWGFANTETLSQSVTIPVGCTTAQLSFFLKVTTAETWPYVYDTLTLRVTPAGGTATVLTQWSNLTPGGYALHTFDLSAYAGKTVSVSFTGVEDYSKRSDFMIDDVSLMVG